MWLQPGAIRHNSAMTWTLPAVLILAAALLLFRRARRQPAVAERPEAEHGTLGPHAGSAQERSEELDAPAIKRCPVCLSEYPSRNRYCVKDGAELSEGRPSGPFSHGMICPTCRRGYPPDAGFCPEDADELVPYGLYGAASSTRPKHRLDAHKICPECGIRHAALHLFCGQDGTELVVVN